MTRSGGGVGRILLALVSAAVLVLTVIGAGVSVLMGQLQGNITAVDISDNVTSDPTTAPLNAVDEETGTYEPLTVVLMGSDSRSGKGNGGFGSAAKIGGERSDTTIVLHVSGDRTSAIGVSIPRDTTVTLPKCKSQGKTVGGYEGRFNQAMDIGGPGCTVKAVEEMSGLDISNFMMVDFRGFKRIVDAVGGVEICLSKPVDDPLSGLKLSKGKHVVEGEEALAFVRARKTLGDGSDTSRIRRQQAFLSSLMRTVLSSGTLLNPAQLLGVLDAATESLTADPQLADINNLKDLALSLKDLKPANVTFTTIPWKPNGDGATVSVNAKKAAPIWKAMKDDTPWPPKGAGSDEDPAPLLKTPPEKIQVDVLNGTTTPKMAKKVARQLRKQGFVVRDVGNADTTDYAQTTVIYDPDWDQSAKTLAAAMDTDVVQKDKKHGSILTVIVGEDFTAVQPVEILDITQDYTAQVNTGDEAFCAS
ncbi:MAG: LCP family protein [Candidatus Nanopelagicales bacterium]|jgi:LCP family protein required for cell wall assembly